MRTSKKTPTKNSSRAMTLGASFPFSEDGTTKSYHPERESKDWDLFEERILNTYRVAKYP
jgi:hypothetical protein